MSYKVVEKDSALLEIDGEEQIPVDVNHEEMCKFKEREDDAYEKIFRRIRRVMKNQDGVHLNRSCTWVQIHTLSTVCGFAYVNLDIRSASSYNKYYCVPQNLSAIFTGRDNIIQMISEVCLPSDNENNRTTQKRFVLYGLGGSGKTQTCIKFAHDYQKR